MDDEAELLKVLNTILTGQGYLVAGFTASLEALEVLREQDFDLLLTDLMMPGMDGLALLRAGLEIDPHLVGLVMTGQGTVPAAVEAMQLGAVDYVLKPFKISEILPVVSRAMEMRRLRLENVELSQTVAIYELTAMIAFTLDLNLVLDKTAEAALQQCQADEVSIMLPDEEAEELFVAAVRGVQREHILGERVGMNQSVAGWVAHHREAVLLHGASDDSRFALLRPRAEVGASISLPMVVGGKLVGVLNINDTHRRRPFTQGERKALSILTSIAAAALESAALHAQVREAEGRYRSIFDSSLDMIIAVDLDRKITEFNQAAQEAFGYRPEEVIGKPFFLYADPEEGLQIHRQTMLHGRCLQESNYRRKNGEVFPGFLSTAICYNQAGEELGTMGVLRDITAQKQAEKALHLRQEHEKALQQQLFQTQKMEALGRLAGGIVHDFNNLLGIIAGYTQTLMRKFVADKTAEPHLQEIQKAADRGIALVRQILAFSRRQTTPAEALDFNAIVADMEKMLRLLSGGSIELTIALAPDLGLVKADRSQLEQVLMNLVVNARDAMPQGGRLKIETTQADLGQEEAQRLDLERPGPYVVLAVSDTGVGMDAPTQARIFEPFFTTKEEGKGTGLGLATVYGIAKQHHGSIQLHSCLGEGTTFRIYWPWTAGEQLDPSRS